MGVVRVRRDRRVFATSKYRVSSCTGARQTGAHPCSCLRAKTRVLVRRWEEDAMGGRGKGGGGSGGSGHEDQETTLGRRGASVVVGGIVLGALGSLGEGSGDGRRRRRRRKPDEEEEPEGGVSGTRGEGRS